MKPTFCASQEGLADQYLGSIPAVGWIMVSFKLGETPCFIPAGEVIYKSGLKVDKNTIFELASATKVFTTAILALRTNRVNVFGPVKPYLPPGYLLKNKEEDVTFQQLATFTGGFSWDSPPGWKQKGTNIITSFTQGEFVSAVNDVAPKKSNQEFPGTDLPTAYHYSNGSVGFLGQILMNIDSFPIDSTGIGFSDWIWANLTGPLNMPNTSVEPGGSWATGYKVKNGNYKSLPPFPWEPWGAAGALRSNAKDMLQFLEANICAHHQSDPSCTGFPKHILDALALSHAPNVYLPTSTLPAPIIYAGSGGAEQAWAWRYLPPPPSTKNGSAIIAKNGGHPGFSSLIAFNPDKSYGLVILMNTRYKKLTAAGIQIIRHTP
jgi:CubicO group peptidase (beta-lactamase class C family)